MAKPWYSPRVLTQAEVYGLVLPLFPYGEVDNAVNIARLESAFNTGAWNQKGEDSRGLFQINVSAGAHPELAEVNLFDPQINTYYALQIWLSSGWRAWFNSASALGLLG